MTIENLELEVKQSGIDQAAKALGRLKNAIAGLQTALNGNLNFAPIKDAVSSLSGIGKVDAGPGLSKLASGLSSLNEQSSKIDTAKLQTLAQALTALAQVGKISSIPKGFTDGIKNIGEAAAKVDAGSVSKLEKLGTALSKFTGIGTIPKNLGERIKEISTAASTLDGSAIKKLSQLGDALQKFKGLSGIGISARDARNVGNAANAANSAGNRRNSNSGTTNGNSSGTDNSKGSFLGAIGNGIANAAKKEIPLLGELSGVLAGVSSAAAGAAGALGYLATKFVITSVKEIISNFKKISSSIKDVGTSLVKSFWNTTPFARFGEAVKDAAKKVSGLVRSIGRVAFYRLIRYAIKELTTAFSDGVEAIYNYDSALNGKFSQTMDGLYQKMNQLKASFGTLAANLINLVGPALNAILNIVIKLSDGISALLAALGGGVFYKAAEGTGSYADSLDSAASSAAELKNQLLGFDEINRLEDNSSSGSSTSSGINFEAAELAGWLQEIQDLIAESKFKEAGAALAEHLNGIVESWDAQAWGKNLGTKIQHAIEFALGFMENFHFDVAGAKLADALGSMVTSISAFDLGALLAEEWNAVIEGIDGFIKRLDEYNLGTWLGNLFNTWFSDIRLDEAVSTVDDALEFALDEIGNFIATFDLATHVETLSTRLGELLSTIADDLNSSTVTDDIIKWLNDVDWAGAATAISDGAVALLDALVNIFQKLDKEKVFDNILGALKEVDWASIAGEIAYLAIEWFKLKLKIKWEATKGFFSSGAKDLVTVLGNVFSGSSEENAESIETTYGTAFDSISAEASATTAAATEAANAGANAVTGAYSDAIANLNTDVSNFQFGTFSATKDALNDVEANSAEIDSVSTETAQAIRDEIALAVKDSGEVFAEGMEDMIEAIQSFQKDSGTSFGALKNQLSTSMEALEHTIYITVTSMQTVFDSKMDAIDLKATTIFGNLESTVSTSMTNIESTISSHMSSCITLVENAASRMKSALTMSTSVDYSFKGNVLASGKITTRATGGYVDNGNLFIAGEAGPELVGQIGSKTAVANNEQIIEGIRSGVYDAVTAAMSNSGTNKDVSVKVYLDSKEIRSGQQRLNRAMGV